MIEPRTEAGRRLLKGALGDWPVFAEALAAIEAEARAEGYEAAWKESSIGVEGEIAEAVAAERARIAEGVPLEEWWERGLRYRNGSDKLMASWVRAAVLSLIEEKP